MKKHKKAKLHSTDFLDDFLDGILQKDLDETTARMKLAAAIDDAMKAQNISKSELAKKMDKNSSVITKWLSGTHNFTTDTLEEIEQILGISLLSRYNTAPVILEKKILMKIASSEKAELLS